MRNGAALIFAAGLALTTAGCGFMVPQATEDYFDPSDGVTVKLGEVTIANIIAFSGDTGESNLVFGAVNNTGSTQTVNFQFETASGQKSTVPVTIAAGYDSYGIDDTNLAVGGVPAGALKEVYIQYGDVPGVETHIPVLDASEWDMYEGLNP